MLIMRTEKISRLKVALQIGPIDRLAFAVPLIPIGQIAAETIDQIEFCPKNPSQRPHQQKHAKNAATKRNTEDHPLSNETIHAFFQAFLILKRATSVQSHRSNGGLATETQR